MKMPSPSPEAIARFEKLVPADPRVTVRKVFGQPAAFANGNMFFGVFGPDIFLRLPETDLAEAAKGEGARPFEPMPGRPMRGYCVLSHELLSDRRKFGALLASSLEFAGHLPAKGAKGKKG
ncbi:MAG: TfoX/Sxy family protein [Thermoplasmata archaeon]|nr:TfoX/Sxy family protein [Thermoplasmata archaeon]